MIDTAPMLRINGMVVPCIRFGITTKIQESPPVTCEEYLRCTAPGPLELDIEIDPNNLADLILDSEGFERAAITKLRERVHKLEESIEFCSGSCRVP